MRISAGTSATSDQYDRVPARTAIDLGATTIAFNCCPAETITDAVRIAAAVGGDHIAIGGYANRFVTSHASEVKANAGYAEFRDDLASALAIIRRADQYAADLTVELKNAKRARDAYRLDSVDELVGGIDGRTGGGEDAGVVDPAVEAAEAFEGKVGRRSDGACVGNVHEHGDHLATSRCAHVGGEQLCGGQVEVAHHHIGTGFSEAAHHLCADTACPAGDHDPRAATGRGVLAQEGGHELGLPANAVLVQPHELRGKLVGPGLHGVLTRSHGAPP